MEILKDVSVLSIGWAFFFLVFPKQCGRGRLCGTLTLSEALCAVYRADFSETGDLHGLPVNSAILRKGFSIRTSCYLGEGTPRINSPWSVEEWLFCEGQNAPVNNQMRKG